MLQVSQLVGDLEKLLDGPTISQSLGQMAVNVISNLMDGDSVALSASSDRYNSHNPRGHIRSHTVDFYEMFRLLVLPTGWFVWSTIWVSN